MLKNGKKKCNFELSTKIIKTNYLATKLHGFFGLANVIFSKYFYCALPSFNNNVYGIVPRSSIYAAIYTIIRAPGSRSIHTHVWRQGR
jgi:hypothetical protein